MGWRKNVTTGGDTALKVFYADEVQASRRWRSERSRWWFDPEEAPKSTITYWCDRTAAASIEIVDGNGNVVRTFSDEAVKGMNSFKWDLLVDQDLALAAETAALEKASEEAADQEEQSSPGLASTPYAESVRLGHALYAMPGDYTVRVVVGENSASTELKIKAPEGFKPRFEEPYKVRGRK